MRHANAHLYLLAPHTRWHPMPQKILIVDDDPHIRQVVRFALEKAGYLILEAANGQEALTLFTESAPNLVVLDVLMPEMDGTEVCRRLRASSAVPILFLSSRDDEVDRIVGLELGGDDYVTKPFSPRELVARVRALLRRTAPAAPQGEESEPGAAAAPRGGEGRGLADQPLGTRILRHGRLTLDLDRFLARWDQAEVVLTATELALVEALLGFPGKVFGREELIDRAYRGTAVVTDRTIDSHVRRVRQKFAEAGGAPIETVHGVGYRLGPCL